MDEQQPGQGPVVKFRPRPFDFARFDRLMEKLQAWRSDDHEDNIVLCRSEVVEVVEGVKALRGDQARLQSRERRDPADFV